MELIRQVLRPRKRLSLAGIWVGMHVLEKDTARYGMVREIRGDTFYITLANGKELMALRCDIESVTDYQFRTWGWWRGTVANYAAPQSPVPSPRLGSQGE